MINYLVRRGFNYNIEPSQLTQMDLLLLAQTSLEFDKEQHEAEMKAINEAKSQKPKKGGR